MLPCEPRILTPHSEQPTSTKIFCAFFFNLSANIVLFFFWVITKYFHDLLFSSTHSAIQSLSIILYIVLSRGTAAVKYIFQNIWQHFIPDSHFAKVLQMSTLFNKINFLCTWSTHCLWLITHGLVPIPMFQHWKEEECVGCDPWASWHCNFLCLAAWLDTPSMWNSDSLFPLSKVKEANVTGEKRA